MLDKNILILGETGLLAQAVTEIASHKGYKAYFASRSRGCDLTSQNVCKDLSNLCERVQPSLIFNATGITDLNYCEKKPEQAWLLHVRLPAIIAKIASRTKCPWVHISTDHYYNSKENILHREQDVTTPPNEYATSKLAGETLALTSESALVIRTNIIGRRRWVNQSTFAEWVMGCLRGKKTFDAYIDTWASSIEVKQFVNLALALAESGEKGLINLACSVSISKAELIEKIAYHSGYSTEFMNKVKTPCPTVGQVKRANAMGLDCSIAEKRLFDLGLSLPNADDVAIAVAKSFME